jgi:hypothetical protein
MNSGSFPSLRAERPVDLHQPVVRAADDVPPLQVVQRLQQVKLRGSQSRQPRHHTHQCQSGPANLDI